MQAIQSNVALHSGTNVAAARTQATGVNRTPEEALVEAQTNLANGKFTAQMQRDMENGLFTPQQLFGPNTMYHVQFSVAGIGTHHHIIYIPKSGPAQIMVGGPHPSGQLVVEVGDLNNSSYRPLPGGATQQVSNIPVADPSAAWPTMVGTATRINQSGLYYHGWNQNSNSVAQTVINTAGFQINDNYVWDGISPGLQNNLQGEMNGTETPAASVLMTSANQNPNNVPNHLITLDNHSPDLSDPNSGSPFSIYLQEQQQQTPNVDTDNRPINGTFSEAIESPKPVSQNPISGNQPAGFDNVNPQIAAQLIEAIGSRPHLVIGEPVELHTDQSNLTDMIGEPVETCSDESSLIEMIGEPIEKRPGQGSLLDLIGKPIK